MTLSRSLFVVGILLFFGGFSFIALTYFPLLKNELLYSFYSQETPPVVMESTGDRNEIVVADTTFGIVIPKIRANAKVLGGVDPFNSQLYQEALMHGVAHAKGSALPTENGNVFIFSHSSVDFWQAQRYNSVFYLLSKLTSGDVIYLYYQGKQYEYIVRELLTVQPEDVSYLHSKDSKKMLTLMTCTPAGTSLKRLLVLADHNSL